ncbi:uncharacterized protein [Argopecten irradians]|uniref:uncharacterized protein n=1 Tax=Argopecten irradians TaxID=31199 RepID=UPI0037185A77
MLNSSNTMAYRRVQSMAIPAADQVQRDKSMDLTVDADNQSMVLQAENVLLEKDGEEKEANIATLRHTNRDVAIEPIHHNRAALRVARGYSRRASIPENVAPPIKTKVTLDTKTLFDNSDNEDYFDMGYALSKMKEMWSPKMYFSTLTLSGIEQLTDMVFLALKCQAASLQSLEEFTLSGAPYVTDMGIQWLTEIPDISIKKISLEGCPNLTDRSLHTFLRMKPTSISIKAMPKFSCLDPAVNQTEVSISGCNLISPPETMLTQNDSPVGKGEIMIISIM